MNATSIKIVTYLRNLKDNAIEAILTEVNSVVQGEVWEIVNEARRNKPGKVLTEDDHAAFLFGLGTMTHGEFMKKNPGQYLVLRVAITAGQARAGSNIEIGGANIPTELILKYEGHNLHVVNTPTVH